jgi:hypothetical protein
MASSRTIPVPEVAPAGFCAVTLGPPVETPPALDAALSGWKQAVIIDRFYRADLARTRSGGGAGLGLAITKRLVEAHHGVIWADSSPGRGTTISFALPMG